MLIPALGGEGLSGSALYPTGTQSQPSSATGPEMKGNSAALSLTNISKSFSGVTVLSGVSFTAEAGRVLAIVGENGAGKSTLKNIICGLLRPDHGTIEVLGQEVPHLTPALARQLGIAAVHQELSLFPSLTVAENMYVGMLPKDRWGNVRLAWVMAECRKLLHDTLGEQIDPLTLVEDLSLGQRQMVEVAKALVRARNIIIFDEPTTSLSIAERARLLEAIRSLRLQGYSVLFISHFFEEIYAVADDIVVLRDGNFVAAGRVEDLPPPVVERHMVGRELAAVDRLARPPMEDTAKTLLEVEGVSDGERVRDVALRVRAGEIVGLGGLLGAGRSELAQALVGLRPATGSVKVDGKVFSHRSPERARHLGMVLVSEDRRGEQAFLNRPVRENLLAGHIGPEHRRYGIISRYQERKAANAMVQAFGVKCSSLEQDLVSLSGGNQQKVILARWLMEKPRICILDEPTKGIDVGAKAEIHMLVRRLAEQGTAVILISSDMPELMALSHRIVIMRKGEIVGELKGHEFEPDTILRLASVGSRT
ncbi:sugar ABC transporter ATP-binding protein [Acidisoma sp. L85]|uniref:sugar ABC transporter ATP-binding protein n=1 Tax=Acidisoma sp. L85 TaxID=1641850 RepID=UPI00131C278F|nr:sugar ABC transporter ATP-binding protein [Acidisoma sp. L85]